MSTILQILRELGQIRYTTIESEKEDSNVQDSNQCNKNR